MKSLSAPLRIQYQTLAEDSKQYVVGNQFAEFIKLQQATSKSATPKRFSFELYVADDKYDCILYFTLNAYSSFQGWSYWSHSHVKHVENWVVKQEYV